MRDDVSTARLVLASASPRRRELLQSRDVAFTVIPADIPEIAGALESAAQFVERMAREKALAVAERLDQNAWVLGADTVVVVDDDILGKPNDHAEAESMLSRLSNRVHQVLTGVALIDPQRHPRATFHVSTDVEMRAISATEIGAYVASGEPMDKAGAYAIQGGAAPFIVRIGGSYTNVVGLPLDEVGVLLAEHGLL